MKAIAAILGFLLTASASALAREPARIDVTVHVTGLSDPAGEIYAGLYDAAGWNGDRFVSAAHVAVTGREATLHLPAPAPGKYAIKLFQDLEGTGKLAKNFLGIPTEPYAFSNNVKGRMGPPAFEAAAFDVGSQGAQQDVRLQ